MANRLLNELAVIAGKGLAIGVTSGRAMAQPAREPLAPGSGVAVSRISKPVASGAARDEVLDLEPLLDRLERIEARIEFAGQQAPAARRYAALFADLERLVEDHSRELTMLRERVNDAEAKAAERQMGEDIPSPVEKNIAARFDELERRFTAEIEQSRRLSLETMESALDEKLTARIDALERTLTAQAGSVSSLVLRAADTDTSLQRRTSAVELLCQRVEAAVPGPPRNPTEARKPLAQERSGTAQRERKTPLTIDARPTDIEQAGVELADTPIVGTRPTARTTDPPVQLRVPPSLFRTVPGPAPKKPRFPFFR